MTAVARDVVFDAPIETAYAVITDFARYPRFLKDIKAVKILKATKTSAEVFFRLTVFKEIDYTLTFTLKAPTSITWKLKSGDSFRKNAGSWKLKRLGKTATEAIYTLDVDLGIWIPGFVSTTLVSSSLPATLKAFKAKIESPPLRVRGGRGS